MSGSTELYALAERLRRAGAGIAAHAARVEAGEPWPLSDDFGTAPESHWGPPETLAHVAEMLPFWIGQVELVLAGDPEPVPFGRVATDPLRLGVIERDRGLPARELFARIAADVDRIAGRVGELDDADGARRGTHPRLGAMTAAVIVERFIVTHLEEHAEQLGSLAGEKSLG